MFYTFKYLERIPTKKNFKIMENKSDYFEYIIHKLLSKYGDKNDFSILKSLLLSTFVIQTNANTDDSCILITKVFNNFIVSPLAAYDKDVYKKIKNNELKTMVITHYETTINSELDITHLDPGIIKLIDKSINKLLDYNKDIIFYKSIILVEIIHMHNYWMKSYHKLREYINSGIEIDDLYNNNLNKIPLDEIIKSKKYWRLNPFELI